MSPANSQKERKQDTCTVGAAGRTEEGLSLIESNGLTWQIIGNSLGCLELPSWPRPNIAHKERLITIWTYKFS